MKYYDYEGSSIAEEIMREKESENFRTVEHDLIWERKEEKSVPNHFTTMGNFYMPSYL